MKYIFFVILFAIFFASSCADQLDLYSHVAIPPEAVAERDIPALRNGMYWTVQRAGGATAFITFDILGGVLMTGTGNERTLINATLSPLGAIVVNSWSGNFSALYTVNSFIEAVERFSDSPSTFNSMARGEAYYFRAYIYYCLATRYGDVPIIRRNTLDLVRRDPLPQVWAFIEEDLNIAIDLLGASANYYYVSQDAATALKARVMLSQGKMAEAAELAESLITSGRYRLDAFENIFRKRPNTEIIFAFENQSTAESNINLSDLFYTYAHAVSGQYSYRPTPAVMAMFDDNDTRRAMSIDNVAGNNVINKYPSGQTGRDPVIISRIAEMYLISAEAQGRVNGVSRLNELRRFRGLTDIFPASDDAFIEAILLERKKELLAENFMYYDYVRTGKAAQHLGLLPHQMVLPISSRELQLNPNLEPNPGY